MISKEHATEIYSIISAYLQKHKNQAGKYLIIPGAQHEVYGEDDIILKLENFSLVVSKQMSTIRIFTNASPATLLGSLKWQLDLFSDLPTLYWIKEDFTELFLTEIKNLEKELQ